jgi:hypothetical protein
MIAAANEVHLMFRVVGASVGDILERHVRIKPALGNGLETVGTKVPSVSIDGLSSAPPVRPSGKSPKSMSQLRLSGTELTKDFGDGSSLDTTFEEFVSSTAPW